jgi:hypothetical protein
VGHWFTDQMPAAGAELSCVVSPRVCGPACTTATRHIEAPGSFTGGPTGSLMGGSPGNFMGRSPRRHVLRGGPTARSTDRCIRAGRCAVARNTTPGPRRTASSPQQPSPDHQTRPPQRVEGQRSRFCNADTLTVSGPPS